MWTLDISSRNRRLLLCWKLTVHCSMFLSSKSFLIERWCNFGWFLDFSHEIGRCQREWHSSIRFTCLALLFDQSLKTPMEVTLSSESFFDVCLIAVHSSSFAEGWQQAAEDEGGYRFTFHISFVISSGPVSARPLHSRSVRKFFRPNFRDDSSKRELELELCALRCATPQQSSLEYGMQSTKERNDDVLDYWRFIAAVGITQTDLQFFD